jgi:hypothetical protein
MPRTTPYEPLVEIECISEEGHGALPLRDVRLGKQWPVVLRAGMGTHQF